MKSFVVIGLGRFGSSIARRLYELGHEVLAIDTNEEEVHAIADYVTHAVSADCCEPGVLKSLGVRNFDTSIVAIGADMQASILTTVVLKEEGVKNIIAKAQSDLQAKILNKVGADRVVFPERDMGIRLANSLSSSNVSDYIDYIELSQDYSIAEIYAPESWVGQTLKDLNVRVNYGINIMAIKNDDNINIALTSDTVIKEKDILVVIGSTDDLDSLT